MIRVLLFMSQVSLPRGTNTNLGPGQSTQTGSHRWRQGAENLPNISRENHGKHNLVEFTFLWTWKCSTSFGRDPIRSQRFLLILGACWCPVRVMKTHGGLSYITKTFLNSLGEQKWACVNLLPLVWAYKSDRTQTGGETDLYLPPSLIMAGLIFLYHPSMHRSCLTVCLPADPEVEPTCFNVSVHSGCLQ